MSPIAEVLLQDVAVGARVAEDVSTSDGQLLVPAGVEITEKLLEILGRRNVESICVVEVIADEAERQRLRQEVQDKLDQQFHCVDDSGTVQDLKAMLFRYHSREFQ